ncbi:hypothetical protein ASPZODRAFT_17959 [Penicilliopsis zonata CBS 506.65]|uniref:Uncharacterized protein n=1 Tax=Penicilliopsis zonata CBS 506.65 TaxID=1073090 RepID=A0A1L9SCV9_9EURO|nr:hypothetical protein ASPZODRAFT_17959 [Penicilliopsis zonata CBS 506.65]OJJ45045.1 hypothetical protein ASPZODRAFT_17959 [Penicilliopsis zonata CBS 506.65]
MASGALIQSSVRRTDPTITLKQALASFEDALMDEQKAQYQTSTTSPDAASVIEFVAQIDAKNSTVMRRCVAPRLCTFLEATQQFTSVVDTFVSSNPTIAALVWGGVRTTLLTASNVAAYFEKVTGMIMRIGKSCPTYQQFGQLYPGCIDLQRALCDYFAIIIQLCIKIIEVSRRNTVAQTFSSILYPFESEFQSFLNNLQQAEKEIQLQLSFASKKSNYEASKLLEQEARENVGFRRSAFGFFKESSKEQAEMHQWRIDKAKRDAAKLRSRIRESLSTVNYIQPWKLAKKQHVPGTAEWLQQELDFVAWEDEKGSANLWCSGTMGMGKTTIVSNVVAYLHKTRKKDHIISYFFCRSDDEESRSARSIIGCLVRQLLDVRIGNARNDDLEGLYMDSRHLDTTNDVVNFVLSKLDVGNKYYIILDGLDECEEGEVRDVAQALAQIINHSTNHIKLLCSGRPELEKQLLRVITPQYRIQITEEKLQSDMELYISMELGRCLEEELLHLGDPTLILKISEALQDGSHGMFLWTRFFIEELCTQACDSDILEALKNLPHGLSELFDRKIHRIQKQKAAKQAIKMLQFCGVAKRPLTAMEYREALSLEPYQKSLDRSRFPNDMNQIISDCCGLVFMDEEASTVQYVHHSIKQHLFSLASEHSATFVATTLDQHFGLLCMTYLDLTNFKQPNDVNGQTALYAAAEGGYLNIVDRLLRAGTRIDTPVTRVKAKLELYPETGQFQILENDTGFGLESLKGREALSAAACNGHLEVVERLMAAGADVTQDPILEQRTLTKAAGNGHLEVVERLLAAGVDARPNIIIGPTAHAAAAGNGHLEVVERLLATGADVRLSPTLGQLALNAAAGNGHLNMVERLLDTRIIYDPDNTSKYPADGGLVSAAENGHLEIVEKLLAAYEFAGREWRRTYLRRALDAATTHKHWDIVEKLRQAGELEKAFSWLKSW